MNLIQSRPSENQSVVLDSLPQKRGRLFRDGQRDHSVIGKLVFTSLTGLLAVVSAICTTMIELGAAWRYSWLAICILLAALMLVGIISVGAAIGKQESRELRAESTFTR
ncbi:MAG TPA: hypothetical protein VK673_17415 [Chthoniobacterales bacterium]|nr:hypothetical protein [Verrucomicrobiota bacterium]HTD16965.1 hypothetical protein [Chthoniobacterales bacterium]